MRDVTRTPNRRQGSEADSPPLPGARASLVLLLLINLFNYIDRYVLAAVEPNIAKDFFGSKEDAATLAKMGSLATAFLVSYMVTAPLFGWLADRMSRWLLVGVGVTAVEFGDRGFGVGGDVWAFNDHAIVCGRGGSGVWAGSAHDYF